MLTESDRKLDPSLRTLIEHYVLTGSMKEYLLKIKNGSYLDLSQKASEVLRELERYSKQIKHDLNTYCCCDHRTVNPLPL